MSFTQGNDTVFASAAFVTDGIGVNCNTIVLELRLEPRVRARDTGRGPMLAHAVFFTLKERSAAAAAALVAACHRQLSGHEGMIHYSAGTRDPGLTREVNDRDFDVALITVFADRSAHDRYQLHPRDLAFVAEQGPSFARVRVFDAETAVSPGGACASPRPSA